MGTNHDAHVERELRDNVGPTDQEWARAFDTGVVELLSRVHRELNKSSDDGPPDMSEARHNLTLAFDLVAYIGQDLMQSAHDVAEATNTMGDVRWAGGCLANVATWLDATLGPSKPANEWWPESELVTMTDSEISDWNAP